MNPYEIIEKYYDKNSKLYHILIKHSEDVRDKAIFLAKKHPELNIDLDFVREAAMIHDIGIFKTDAPGIECYGEHQYIEHGYLGADIMREEGYPRHALVCERHTGTGLKLDYILEKNLPIPHRDLCPVSIEEQLICYADKFFSKSRIEDEDSIEKVKKKMAKWGDASLDQLGKWEKLFE